MASNFKCPELDERGAVEEEEENDMLLYMWQKAAFLDSGQGIPREVSDSLRLRIAQLSSYHTKLRQAGRDSFGTGWLLKDYLGRYAKVMDDGSEKGMNNFKETMGTVLAGKVIDQRNWESSLQSSVVMEMPEFKALLKEAETYSKNPSLEEGIPLPASTILPYPTGATSVPPTSRTVPPPKVPQDPSSKPPPNQTTQRKGLFQYTSGTTSSSKGGEIRGSVGEIRGPVGEVRGSVGPPMKRNRVAMEADEPEVNVQAFSTARDEYVRQQQRRYGGRGGGGGASNFSGSYGSSKKVLGTRIGVSNRFVPPVRRDSDGSSMGSSSSSEAELRSRVLKNKETGGGASTSSSLPPELEGDERLKNIEPRMVEMIMNEIMDHSAPVEWTDIAGLEFAKATIKEIVVWPMMRPDLFTGLRGPPKGILLFGPPGTGKTLIGKCIASQVDATFFSISASSLTSKWIGEGEKMVRALFAVARCFQPAVVFMDEIDSLLTQRSDTEHESSRRIKTEFLVQLDGATTNDADRLLVIGATNRPQEIDEAARRRLVKRLYIPLPDAPARKQIVLNLMKQQPFHLAEDDLDTVCRRTEGYSGADMTNLCREAAYGPVREAASSIQHISADDMRKVLYKDFEAALLVIRASVSEKDLDLYIEWNKQFGCGVK